VIETTVGRVLFNRILPPEVQFTNEKLDKGGVKDLIADVYELCGQDPTTEVADRIKALGFEFAMRSGTTLAVADISIPPERKDLLAGARAGGDRERISALLCREEQNEHIVRSGRRPPTRRMVKAHGSTATFHHGQFRCHEAASPFHSWRACAV
jgi:DNA-directed RNA polymerase subunit beta'